MSPLFTTYERISASRAGRDAVLKLGSALELIQDCSLAWMESEQEFTQFLGEKNLIMVLISRQADFLRLPVYGEHVTVKTSIFDCRSFFGYRNTAMYGEDGKPCILTWSVGTFIDRTTGKMTRLSPDVSSAVTLDERLEMDYLDRRIALPPLSRTRLAPFAVRRCDIDFNGHMNNARYVEQSYELLPEDRPVRRLRVEYKASARAGDLLYPEYAQTPGGKIFVLLTDSAGKPYTIAEFS